MFGAAPIERSSLTASQKSKSPSPAGSMSAARSEKELTQLLMSGLSTEHMTLTRSGSAGQLGMSSTTTVTSDVASVHTPSMTQSMRQPVENTQRGTVVHFRYCTLVPIVLFVCHVFIFIIVHTCVSLAKLPLLHSCSCHVCIFILVHMYVSLTLDVFVRMNHHAIATMFVRLSVRLGRVCIVIIQYMLAQI